MLSRTRALLDRHRRPAVFAGWMVGFAVAVGGSYVAFSRFTGLSVAQRLTAAGILANGVLTFALLWVYTEMAGVEARQAAVQERQTEIQRRQTDIQERQAAWMEAEHAPMVRVEEFGPVLGPDDVFEVTLRNDGNGLAKDVSVRWELLAGDDALHLDSRGAVTDVTWLDPEGRVWNDGSVDGTSAAAVAAQAVMGRPRAGGDPVVGPGERVQLWVGAEFLPDDVVVLDGTALPSLTAVAEPMGMPALFDALATDGFDAVHVGLQVTYRNVGDDPTTRTVAARRMAVEPGLTVRDVVRALVPDESDGR